MAAYILRRLLLMIPTIFGIMAISFAIVQFAPGGPVERIIAQLQGHDAGATARFTTVNDGAMATAGADANSAYRGSQGLDPEFIAELEKQFGFDRPVHERFARMIYNYARFDFRLTSSPGARQRHTIQRATEHTARTRGDGARTGGSICVSSLSERELSRSRAPGPTCE